MLEIIQPEIFVDKIIEASNDADTHITIAWYDIDTFVNGLLEPDKRLPLNQEPLTLQRSNPEVKYCMEYDESRIRLSVLSGKMLIEAIAFVPATGEITHLPSPNENALESEEAKYRLGTLLDSIYSDLERGEIRLVKS